MWTPDSIQNCFSALRSSVFHLILPPTPNPGKLIFSDWLPPLNNVHLRFFHTFHGFTAHFFVLLNNIYWMDIPVYLFIKASFNGKIFAILAFFSTTKKYIILDYNYNLFIWRPMEKPWHFTVQNSVRHQGEPERHRGTSFPFPSWSHLKKVLFGHQQYPKHPGECSEFLAVILIWKVSYQVESISPGFALVNCHPSH